MAGIAQLLSDLPEWLPDREAVASEIEGITWYLGLNLSL